jgi:hypothetical protein
MLLPSLVAILIGLTAAAPGSRLFYHDTQIAPLTVTLHAQTHISPPSTKRETCHDGTRSNDVYIINNRLGACGVNTLKPCTTRADKVERLCGDICVTTVNATNGESANIYGLSHPRPDGGFFILYNGTDCEEDKLYLRYPAQRVGTGPVRPHTSNPWRSHRFGASDTLLPEISFRQVFAAAKHVPVRIGRAGACRLLRGLQFDA